MPEIITTALVLFGPLAFVCGTIFALSYGAIHPGVTRALRHSAVYWFIGLGAIFAIIMIGEKTCGGNMLYGYGNCTILPVSIANLSLPAFAIGTGGGILYGVILVIVSGFVEWRHRRNIA